MLRQERSGRSQASTSFSNIKGLSRCCSGKRARSAIWIIHETWFRSRLCHGSSVTLNMPFDLQVQSSHSNMKILVL